MSTHNVHKLLLAPKILPIIKFKSVQESSCNTLMLDEHYDGTVSNESLLMINNTEEEVLACCKEIDTTKSSCITDVSSRVLKGAFILLVTKFTHLINCSFTTGIFPRNWKIANVVPLFKGGNRNFVGNYRPVSLLQLSSKIIERIVHNGISTYMENNQYLDDKQGGFRKKHSTIGTIANLTNDISNGINNRDITLTCFIDMAKAFDTVNHKILLSKLARLGIGNMLLKWIENYLSLRKQCTSSFLDIKCGVLQGSILGPLFFIIYVNDLSKCLKHCQHLLYADDTVIYITGEIVDKSRLMQTDLDSFKK